MLFEDLSVVSVDLETGGLEPGVHSVLSIGAVAVCRTDIDPFYAQLEWDNFTITPQAMAVNGLDILNPPGRHVSGLDRSLPANEGLEEFSRWLRMVSDSEPIHAMGMNVGSFDLPMLKAVWDHEWPFHYRSIDLNSIMFLISSLSGVSYSKIKKTITDRATELLKRHHPGARLHHALFDAWFNAYVWGLCEDWFKGDNYGN